MVATAEKIGKEVGMRFTPKKKTPVLTVSHMKLPILYINSRSVQLRIYIPEASDKSPPPTNVPMLARAMHTSAGSEFLPNRRGHPPASHEVSLANMTDLITW